MWGLRKVKNNVIFKHKNVMIYTIWNNKGGTGKTSLSFQIITEYASIHSEQKILVVDLCPQANLSELLLGGLVGRGGDNLAKLGQENPRKTVGGYFANRIQSTFNATHFTTTDYLCKPSNYNANISENIDLVAGDRLVEIQGTALSSLANTQLPGVDSRLAVTSWIAEFIHQTEEEYDTIFIDTNPSFAIHTQMGIFAADRLLVPIMADDSSRRAIINLFTLIYGINLPDPIYENYQFANLLKKNNGRVPKIHLIIRNRITQYMGEASAYGTVLNTIRDEAQTMLNAKPELFTFRNLDDGMVSVKDFGTTGVVAFAEGKPFSILETGKHNIEDHETKVNKELLIQCIDAISQIVMKID